MVMPSELEIMKRLKSLPPWLMLSPAIVVLAAIVGWPLINLVIMSTQKYGRAQVFGAPPEFVGLDNFAFILQDDKFWGVFNRSIAFAAVNVIATMVLGTIVALAMFQMQKAWRLLVQAGLLVAWAMPQLTAVIVWGWMFNTEYGVINFALSEFLGLDYLGHSWFSEPLSFFAVATIIITWQSVPFVAFTLYAGLTQIPNEVREAAMIDGANSVQRFRNLIVPYLRPVFAIVITLQIIWDLRVFTQIYALQGLGGLREETNTLGVYIYQVSLGSGNYGMGGAISLVMVVLMSTFAFYYVRRTLREVE
jgi:N,N'-diacetylchitobiose transport system permease protein